MHKLQGDEGLSSHPNLGPIAKSATPGLCVARALGETGDGLWFAKIITTELRLLDYFWGACSCLQPILWFVFINCQHSGTRWGGEILHSGHWLTPPHFCGRSRDQRPHNERETGILQILWNNNDLSLWSLIFLNSTWWSPKSWLRSFLIIHTWF